jgi:uncharacterized Tic20 family protein
MESNSKVADHPDHSAAQGPLLVRAFRKFTQGILDFRFQHYLTMQLLPVFYGLLLLGILGVFAGLNAFAFWLSPHIGFIALAITPFALLISFAVTRAALEFMVMAYRIMETVNRMDRIPHQVDNLNSKVDGISSRVEDFHGQIDYIQGRVDDVTHTIQFLKPISGLAGLAGLAGRSKRDGQGNKLGNKQNNKSDNK